MFLEFAAPTSKFFLAALIALALPACSLSKSGAAAGDGGGDHDKTQATLAQSVIRNVSSAVILQTYVDLRTRTAALRDRSLELRASPTQSALESAEHAWREARVSWEQTESFLFGPVEGLGVDGMIDTWPLNRPDLDAIMASGSPITPGTLRTLGTNLKGFHTAEYLLFGDGASTNKKLIQAMTPRELEYLIAVTTVLAEDTAKLASAWESNWNPDDPSTPGYAQVLANPGNGNPKYATEAAVISELVNGMAAIAKEVGNGKIASPLGVDVADAHPEKEESPFSWNSTSDFANNIRSIRMVYTGETATGSGAGIMKLVEGRDPALAAQLLAQIDSAIAKIEAIAGDDGMPFRRAILEPIGRVRVKAAQDEVLKLSAMISSRLQPFFRNN